MFSRSYTKQITIIFSLIYIFTSAVTVILVYYTMKNKALDNAKETAMIILARANAIHDYFTYELKPSIFHLMKDAGIGDDYFDPHWMSSTHAVREINRIYTKKAGKSILYKHAAINARSVEYEADEYEKKFLKELNENKDLESRTAIRTIDNKKYFVVMRKNTTFLKACMKCHSTPENAPAQMVASYGDDKGFNKKLGEVSSALVIKIPIFEPLNEAAIFSAKLSMMLIMVFLMALGAMLFLYRKFIVNPIDDMNRKLEEKVADETSKRLKNERVLLEQKRFADMGQMVSAIAHQWRQPINSLGLIIQYIDAAYNDKVLEVEDMHELAGESRRLVQHMSYTIDDFMNFFSPKKEKEKFNVLQTCADIIGMIEAQLSANNINTKVVYGENRDNLEIEIYEEAVPVDGYDIFGYEGEMKQVIMNLITNAKDAIKDRVDINESYEGKIEIYVFSESEYLSIIVLDNGGGISKEIQNRIFDPYFTTKEEGKGTGIGLYMTKMIVEDSMKGSIDVKNVQDGAEFTVKIPLSQ